MRDYKQRVVVIKESQKPENRSWYSKVWLPHIPLFSSLFIAGATFFVAYSTGLFDVNNKLLEVKRISLEYEINKNESKVRNQLRTLDSLKHANVALIRKLDSTKRVIRVIALRMDSAKIKYNEQKRTIRTMSHEIQAFIKNGETEKANQKMQELISLLNKITYRIHDSTFDSTYD